jgi:alpha-D-xyloside xylohydrolase
MKNLHWLRVALRSSALFPAAFGAALAAPCSPAITAVAPQADRLILKSECGSTLVEPWGETIVRVQKLPLGAPEPRQSLVVIGKKPATALKVTQDDKTVTAETANLQISADRKDGHLSFARPGEKEFLSEDARHSRMTATPSKLYDVAQGFSVHYDDGYFYGLGQQPTGLLDRWHDSVRLQQANGWIGLPFLLTDRGWGLLWDNASVSDVSVDRPQDGGGLQIKSEAAQSVDYYIVAGPNSDAVIAGYRKLTGEAPMLPRWAWGFWQSFEHYATQEETTGIVRRYRDMGVPFDAVIQDWQYWRTGEWGAHTFDSARYPDPTKMMDDIHAMHAHSIVSVWARIDQGTDTRAELEAAGALFPKIYRNVYPAGEGRWYDPYGKGRELYWRQISRTLGRNGFDGWWLDASEAELGGEWGQMREVETAAGPGALVYNAYPLMHTSGVFEGAKRDFPAKRPVILTRSAWAGQQRNNAISWSGDISGTWETFRRQIPAGLNFVASGIPYWNTDIGGFFGGDPADPAYRELFVRWFEYGTFTPMFRVHGTNKPKEMWRFDKDAQDILIRYDRLRYQLLPYIYSAAWAVTSRGSTMMRPLVFDFAADREALDVPDQYMFGPALMVAPVARKGADFRSVYLPGDGDWYDFWTNERRHGKANIDAKAPLDTLPLFVRAGAILPLGPVVQYADETPNAPLELRIYRGADGHFALYDDAGNGFGYERGERAVVEIDWNEKTGVLSFAKRQGHFPGMKPSRTFNIVWIGGKGGTRRIVYDGRAQTVKPPA